MDYSSGNKLSFRVLESRDGKDLLRRYRIRQGTLGTKYIMATYTVGVEFRSVPSPT
jgi:hypothetical protein